MGDEARLYGPTFFPGVDIQYGALVGFSTENVDLAAYVLNPDDDEPVFAFSIEVSFSAEYASSRVCARPFG